MSRAALAGPVALFAALAAAVAPAAAAPADQGPAVAGKRPPNVIAIVTDDQPAAAFKRRLMPRTFKQLVDPGTRFTDSIVATPLCCPSRAALATGQYGHNNGVLTNNYGRLRRPRNVLPRWLQRAGYRTIHVGRFFNGYEGRGREREVAPGWDGWRTALAPRRYYDYELTTRDGRRSFGTRPRDHLTTTLSRIAAQTVERRAPRKRPFYLQLDHFAPHKGAGARDERCRTAAVPGAPDEDAYAGERLPRGAAFDEPDNGDKPSFMQALPRLDAPAEAEVERQWRCALGSLRTLDRGVGELFRALRRADALRETVVIFTSDNGYLYGEHRIALDKLYPYEESVRVPLAIRLPKRRFGRQPERSRAPVANIDLAPTILELAGAEPCRRDGCRVLDGRSLLGEASGEGGIPADRAILLELETGPQPRAALVCGYQGLRTPEDVYVVHSRTRTNSSEPCAEDAAVEHYDRRIDPAQLTNLFPPLDPGLESEQAALAQRLSSLAGCAGIAGRDPLPSGGSHCE